jgi:hypothetical protein
MRKKNARNFLRMNSASMGISAKKDITKWSATIILTSGAKGM